ncbi:MAG TPA: carbon monoxide dehydrogenase subunit G [Nitrososphaerales archaeon]|nr:carbon monoxide dehydrogenase subunit G [Nitrososphaerales archaeon]
MKFHLDGSIDIKAPLEKTYSSLTDPEFMAKAAPDLQSYKVIDQDSFEAKLKIGISLVRGTIDMKFALLDKVQNRHARLVGDGSGAGSKIHIDSSFDLATIDGNGPDHGSTRMNWTADADLSGLMAGIAAQVLKGQSEKKVAQIFENVKKRLEAH